jgi:hypothetical protein
MGEKEKVYIRVLWLKEQYDIICGVGREQGIGNREYFFRKRSYC